VVGRWYCLVVVLYGISTYVANYKNGQLRAAQSALSRAKEEQLTQALKEKEEQIAVAQAQAARAKRERG
jgi:acylphosphatase